MQIHPSTKKLIDRLYDMTLERKIAWKQGTDGAVVYDTERYRVSLVGNPTEVILSSDSGAELDKADHQELTNTLLDDGTTYAEYVGQLHKEAHRIARGAESAIDEVLSTLVDTDGDGVLDSPAPRPEPAVEMPAPSDEIEETVSEPAIEELSSERVADAVASMAKDVNGAHSQPEPIDTVVEPQPEAPPVPAAAPEIQQSRPAAGLALGGLGGQSGFSTPPPQTPPPVEQSAPEPEIEPTAVPAPDDTRPAIPQPIPREMPSAPISDEIAAEAQPDAPSEPKPAPAETPPVPPAPEPVKTGGYMPSPFGITTQRGPAQIPAQPVQTVPPVPSPPVADESSAAPTDEPVPVAPTPPPVPPVPQTVSNPQPANGLLGGSSLGAPSLGVPRVNPPPVPEMPDMGPGVEESKIANLVGSITETVDDDPAPEESITMVPPVTADVPAAISQIADAASPALSKPVDAVIQQGEGAAGSLKERSIGVVDETGEVIRNSLQPETTKPSDDPDGTEPPKPPSKRFNPWR